ncbi:MAG: hypothetical protein HY547_06705 [Elusimicrobia bacterium]|nr:hypothetical protein [Elusimicrobiota bacterium]
MKTILGFLLSVTTFSNAFASDVRDNFGEGRRGPAPAPSVATLEQEALKAQWSMWLQSIVAGSGSALELLKNNKQLLGITDPAVNPGPVILANWNSQVVVEELKSNMETVIRQMLTIAIRAQMIFHDLYDLKESGFPITPAIDPQALLKNPGSVLDQISDLDLGILNNPAPNLETLFDLAYGNPSGPNGSLEGPSIYHVATSPEMRAIETTLEHLNDPNLAAKLTSPAGPVLRQHYGECLPPR